MKVTEALEIISGFGYFVFCMISLYIIDLPIHKMIAERNGELDSNFWSSGPVLFLIPLSLSISISAYLHAFRKSHVALGIIFVVGGFFLCMNMLSILAGSSIYIWIKVSLFLSLLSTIVLAGINTIAHLQHRQNLSRM
jgi:hypothetical protein